MNRILVFPIHLPAFDPWIARANVFGDAHIRRIFRYFIYPITLIDRFSRIERNYVPEEADAANAASNDDKCEKLKTTNSTN